MLQVAAALASRRAEVDAATRIRAALGDAWDGAEWEELHRQLHYLGVR
jgi:hypothetical protein